MNPPGGNWDCCPLDEGLNMAMMLQYREHGRVYDFATVTAPAWVHLASNYSRITSTRANLKEVIEWPQGSRLLVDLPLGRMFLGCDPSFEEGKCVLSMSHGDGPAVEVKLSS